MNEQNSDEISFHLYIDAVKDKKIPWNTFVKVMKDFYYQDLVRLKYLNAIILMELTENYSDLEKSRYLNGILLTELKISIEEQNVVEIIENEPIEDSQDVASIDQKSKEQFDNDKDFTNDQSNEEYDVLCNYEQDIVINKLEIKKELIQDNGIQAQMTNETSSSKIIRPGDVQNIHLKQHLIEDHENNTKHENYNSKRESYDEASFQSHSLKRHIHTLHEGHKDYKCSSCGKSFSRSQYLKKHIHTVHEGHKDYKCNSCGKFFSEGGNLKRHIHTIHEDQEDHKCESCNKSFTRQYNLKKHMHAIHDRGRVY